MATRVLWGHRARLVHPAKVVKPVRQALLVPRVLGVLLVLTVNAASWDASARSASEVTPAPLVLRESRALLVLLVSVECRAIPVISELRAK